MYRLRGADGTYRWFRTRAQPYPNEDGHSYCWYGVATDIDELYRSKEQIQEREFQLNLLTELVPAILWKSNCDGSFEWCNRRAEEYTGRSMAEIKEYGYLDLIHEEERTLVRDRWAESISTGTAFELEFRVRRYDGK